MAFHLLDQLTKKRTPWLFLAWKRNARHLLPHLSTRVGVYTPGRSLAPLPLNPFMAPPGLEPQVYAAHVIDIMAEAYTLGEGARSILRKAFNYSLGAGNDAPTVHELIAQVEALPLTERARGWRLSAIRALESLAASSSMNTRREEQESFASELLHRYNILELDALSQSGKAFLIAALCLWLYYVKLAHAERERLGFVIIIEEAHHVLHGQHRARESVMEMLLRQCREIGIAIVVIDQHPHLISPAVLGNTYTSICLNLKDPRDVSKAAAISLLEDEDRRCFGTLPVGQAVVKLQDRWTKPFVVAFPFVAVAKGHVTDAVLKEYLAGSGGICSDEGVLSGVRRIRLDDNGLDDVALAFIEDVVIHPDDGVKARYKRLGMSVDRGNRLKHGLVEAGWLEAATVAVGRSRKVVLRPTPKAREFLGLDNVGRLRESLAHEYWKRFCARLVEAQGYHVELESPRKGGRVDILATNASERVGIEIETGKSDVVRNVKNCLRSGFDRVVVVATDERALSRVEQELGEEGLLIAGRVMIGHWDEVVRRAA